ncbi:DUF6506 family protein [Fodinibius salsisoli]|uniref:Uncharacterized protein n=1 Tax=Fodinibius salsisoli TaxID=2820877 RepID=A0ABT3PI94_9BACT|nr:DUF6506 family protein [Fodinibius salsisoli]MCW9705508.1 hypothetical protein [Fodinibius salsisoli]
MDKNRSRALIFAGEYSELRALNHNYIAYAPNPSSAAELAGTLTKDKGVASIELCGGTGLGWISAVRSVVEDDIPVGLVTYPFEVLIDIAKLKERYQSTANQTEEKEVFIILDEHADPQTDRIEERYEGGQVTYVAVSDTLQAVRLASKVAEDGATLIELYGGFDFETADTIHEVTNGDVPIGIATFGFYAGFGFPDKS